MTTTRNTAPSTGREPVVFFREEREEDDYHAVFIEAGYEPLFVPVLRTENEETPTWPESAPDAVVVTSRRTLLALLGAPERLEDLRRRVGSAPWYAVGETTARAVRRLGFDVQAETPGTSARLADPICGSGARMVWFLAGQPHRPELEERLHAAGVGVETVILYRTTPNTPASLPNERGWAVLFSPRGVQAAAPLLPGNLRIAAIGPTTAAALAESGLPCDATAESPTAAAVLASIMASDQNPLHRSE